jgi:DNA-binding transcriptional LysR family regulator
MIEFRQLKHIQLLSKYKNFSKAAEAANITQPALSISIKKAEKYFGNILFSRKTKLIELTPQGEIVLSMANQMLEALEKSKVNIINMNNLDKGLVNFGLDTFLSKPLAPPVISKIHTLHPNISFNVNINPWFNLISPLRNGDIDFFITIYSSASDFSDLDLHKEEIKLPLPRYYVRKGHPLTLKKKIIGTDIKEYPWIGNLVSPTFANWLMTVTGVDKNNSNENPFLATVNDSQMGTELVIRSDAISAVSHEDLEQYLEKDLIEILDIEWSIPHPENIGVIVSMTDKEFSPATRLLINEIKKYAKKW